MPRAQAEYFDFINLRDSNKTWHTEWFYIKNQPPQLFPHTGHLPKHHANWDSAPSYKQGDQISQLLKMIRLAKEQGLTAESVVLCFIRRHVQPCHNRVLPGYEYLGREDPMRMCEDELGPTDCLARLQRIFCNLTMLPKVFTGWQMSQPPPM